MIVRSVALGPPHRRGLLARPHLLLARRSVSAHLPLARAHAIWYAYRWALAFDRRPPAAACQESRRATGRKQKPASVVAEVCEGAHSSSAAERGVPCSRGPDSCSPSSVTRHGMMARGRCFTGPVSRLHGGIATEKPLTFIGGSLSVVRAHPRLGQPGPLVVHRSAPSGACRCRAKWAGARIRGGGG